MINNNNIPLMFFDGMLFIFLITLLTFVDFLVQICYNIQSGYHDYVCGDIRKGAGKNEIDIDS